MKQQVKNKELSLWTWIKKISAWIVGFMIMILIVSFIFDFLDTKEEMGDCVDDCVYETSDCVSGAEVYSPTNPYVSYVSSEDYESCLDDLESCVEDCKG